MLKISPFFLLLVLFGCGDNHTPVHQEIKNTLFQSDSLHFSLQYPENWELKDSMYKKVCLWIQEPFKNDKDAYQENINLWIEEMPIPISDSLYAKAAYTECSISNPTLSIKKELPKKLGTTIFYPFSFNFVTNDNNKYDVMIYTCVEGTRGYNFTCTSEHNQTNDMSTFESILSTLKFSK